MKENWLQPKPTFHLAMLEQNVSVRENAGVFCLAMLYLNQKIVTLNASKGDGV